MHAASYRVCAAMLFCRYANSLQKSVTNMPPPAPTVSGRMGGYNQSQSNKENMHTTPNFKSFHSNCNTDLPAPSIGRHTSTYSSRENTSYNHLATTGGPKQQHVHHTRTSNTTGSFSNSPVKPVPGKAMEPATSYVSDYSVTRWLALSYVCRYCLGS